jgi:hypothetical protein
LKGEKDQIAFFNGDSWGCDTSVNLNKLKDFIHGQQILNTRYLIATREARYNILKETYYGDIIDGYRFIGFRKKSQLIENAEQVLIMFKYYIIFYILLQSGINAMRRACRVTTQFLTAHKKLALKALLQAYRATVNFYIKSLWSCPGSLNKDTLAGLNKDLTRLSERYKSNALKQALEMVSATKKSAKALKKKASCPIFKGSAILDSKFVAIEPGEKSFDLVVRVSSLKKGTNWLSRPGRPRSLISGLTGVALLFRAAVCPRNV